MYSDYNRRKITSLLFISLLVKNTVTSHTPGVVLRGRYNKQHRDLSDMLMYSYIYVVPQCIKNKAHLRKRRMDANSNSRMGNVHCYSDVLLEYRWRPVRIGIFNKVCQPIRHLQNQQKITYFVFSRIF